MKRIITAAVLLLSLSIMMVSCNKDSGSGSLIGTWMVTDLVNEKGESIPNTTDTFETWKNATLRFEANDIVWWYGIHLFHYTRQGNSIIVGNDNDSYLAGQTLTISGGKIRTEPFINGSICLLFEKQ